MSTGERSLLSAFQMSAQAHQYDQTGALVPFWCFFDTISKDLEHGINQVVDRAVRAAEDAKGLEPYDVQVLKLLYLIRYIGYVKATVENISIFMIDGLDVDMRALKDRVKESLPAWSARTTWHARAMPIVPYRRGAGDSAGGRTHSGR